MASETDPLEALRAELALIRGQLERAERTLAELQIRDRVTGLLDVRETTRHVRVEIDRCRRYHRQCALVAVGIVDYGGLVQRLGRRGIEQVLARVGQACRFGRRSVDVVGRLEGGEFAMLLPETAADGAAIVVDHVRRACAGPSAPVELPSGAQVAVSVRLAFGIARFPGDATDADGLLAAARGRLSER